MPKEENQTSEEEVVETSSTDVTEGASPSDAAAEEQSAADKAVDAFMEEFGEEETAEADVDPEGQSASAEDPDPDKPETPDAEQKEEPEDTDKYLSDEEFKGLPEGARQRIGSLDSKLKKSRKDLDALTVERDQFQSSHTALEQLQGYATQNNLSPDDVSNGMSMMAMVTNGKHQEFLDAIKPFYERAQRAVGQSVHPDYVALIDSGDMTEEAALAATRDKSAAEAATRQYEQAQATISTQNEQRSNADLQGTMMRAVDDFETKIRSEDPNFALKEPQVRAQFEVMVRQLTEAKAFPKTPESVVAILDSIYKAIPEPIAAKPKPTRLRPTASSKTGVQRTSDSLEDKIFDGLMDLEAAS